VGCSFQKAVHDLRHAGAANDIEQGRREMEGVRRRGRWRHLTSVQRYGKTHLLVAARRKFGSQVLSEGKLFGRDPRRAVSEAICAGPGKHTALGKRMMKRMAQGQLVESKEDLLPGATSPRGPSDSSVPEAALEECTDSELRQLLRSRGLVAKGRRKTLLRRLQAPRANAGPLRGNLGVGDETCPSDSPGELERSYPHNFFSDEGFDVDDSE
jgi:hypothetical protein